MTGPNPFAPPTKATAPADAALGRFDPAAYIAPRGRIGRVRYLALSVGNTVAVVGLGTCAGLVAPPEIALLAAVPLACLLLVAVLGVAGGRVRDLGYSGYAAAALLVPWVGSLFGLILLLAPGNPGPNAYGPPPPAPSALDRLAAIGAGALVLMAFCAGFGEGLQR